MKEKRVLVLVFAVIFILYLSAVSAAITKGSNNSIADKYGPGESLKGAISISFTNLGFNTPVNAFTSTITLKELLENAGVDYECSNSDCGVDYTLASESANSFTLNRGQNKTIGMKIISSSISGIDEFNLNITSSSAESCVSSLIVDILDGQGIEWSSSGIGNSYCGTENYGCYNPNQGGLIAGNMQENKLYCQDITFASGKSFKIGADVSGTGQANFKFSVLDTFCEVVTTASGKIFCDVELDLLEPENLTVCVEQDLETYNNPYKLFTESNNACGFIEGTATEADFSIFSQQKKYAALGNFLVESKNVDYAGQILSYIDSRYQGDCSFGCYIPVKLISNVDNQNITINDMGIKYNDMTKSNNSFYSLGSAAAKISLPSLTTIELSGTGLKVPVIPGQHTLILNIAGEQIVSKKIEVLNLPVVSDLYPTEVPAGAEIIFYASVSGKNISSYKWDFGDGTAVSETTTNSVAHTYSSTTLKNYKLIVIVKNNLGETNSSFTVKTVSPKEYLGSLITEYKSRLANVKKQVATFPASIKSALETAIGLTNLESKLNQAQADYNSSSNQTTEKYISILSTLYTLNMPKSIVITKKISGKFFTDQTKITSAALAAATAEEVSIGDAAVQNAVSDWNLNNINANVNIETYSSVNDNGTSAMISFIKITAGLLDGSNDGTIYAVIAVPKEQISSLSISNPTYSANSVSFPIDLASGEKSFDFIVTGDIDLMQMPIYFTPVASKLSFSRLIGECNHNGICEAGEDSDNCRDDCKPVGLTIFWLVFLVIIFLGVYIGLQEWYKKRYESWLFRDKNDLFNLVSFIENAEKQGLNRQQIFAKLKEKKWPGEQVVFAYKKYKGLRTGMFEIPIFNFFEKNKLIKAVDFKKKIGTEQKIPPEPRKPFTPNMPGKPSIIPFMNKETKLINNKPANNNKPVNNKQANYIN